MGTPTPRPLMAALARALEKAVMSPDDRSAVVRSMAPYAFAHEAILHLFDHSSDLMGICGVDGKFRHVNRAFLDAFGWSFEELTTRPLFEFVHPDDLEITRSKMEKLLAGLDVVRFENRWKSKDGRWKRVSWICPAPPEGGKDLFSLARVVGDA
jgi:PAS domain S-box-containing protein